jgi:predicted dehydrogenase
MIRVGMIGYGYWGPNLLRNLVKTRDCRVIAIADLNPAKLETVKRHYPFLESTTSLGQLLENAEIDAVVIATPISTHYELAKQALRCGKHVLIEKPMTVTVTQANELIRLAELNQKVLMVDHTFIYAGAVQKIKGIIDSGELGELYFYDSVRVNLGLFQPDFNVLWDLAPHDFSIMTYLIDKEPISVSAVGTSPVRWNGWRKESVVYIAVEFADGTLAHFHVNWLSPVKVRRTLISGSHKMIAYDHLDKDYQVKVFDKGVEFSDDTDRYRALVQYRMGDMLVPKIDQTEPLESLCEDFVRCAHTGARPLTDGYSGRRVVQLLEAAQQSMEHGNKVMLSGARENMILPGNGNGDGIPDDAESRVISIV